MARSRTAPAKPFIGVLFDCCGCYGRVYRNKDGSAYKGRCPRCLRPVVVRIAENGAPGRFVRVTRA